MKFEDAIKWYKSGHTIRIPSKYSDIISYLHYDNTLERIHLTKDQIKSNDWEVKLILSERWVKNFEQVEAEARTDQSENMSDISEIEFDHMRVQISDMSENIKYLQAHQVSIADFDYMRGQISDLFGKFKHLEKQFANFVDTALVRLDKLEALSYFVRKF
jgi:hypothetical protein